MAISDRTPSPSPVSSATDISDYRRSFRRHVFHILAVAYDHFDCKSFQNSDEDTITQRLQERGQEFVEAQDAPRWAVHFEVIDQRRHGSAGQTGKRRPILDLLFSRTQRGTHPRFTFEAKRLYEKSGEAEYVGGEGLTAYVDGTYRREDDEAGMLGYVQSDNLDNWAARISKEMTNRATSIGISAGNGWRAVTIARGLTHTYYSRHDRTTVGRSIAMFHILLSFCIK